MGHQVYHVMSRRQVPAFDYLQHTRLTTLCVMLPGERKPLKVLLNAVVILAVSGATAGLLGIGGALIFNPYLLQLGMDPRVSRSAATS